MLEENLSLSRENNSMLKSIRRTQRWGHIMRVSYWIIIILISLGAYYFIQPYIGSILNVYSGGVSDIHKISDVSKTLNPSNIQNIINQYKQPWRSDIEFVGGRGADRIVGLNFNTMKAFVYFLKTESGKYYIGSTVDLDRRLKQHKSGHTHSTKRMGKLELIFSQEYSNLKDARNIEFNLKKLQRKDYIEKIIKEGYIKMTPK